MASNPEVLALLEELIESGRTPEEVCRDCPELLTEVRQRWRAFRRVDGALGKLFPDPESPADGELPEVPGYQVEAVLGRGGMGVVYKAQQVRPRRPVALKMMLAGAQAGPRELARFRREVEAVAGLRHPNVVQVHDAGDVAGRPYFTMEFVEGGSLAQRLQGQPQPARDAAALVATLADAVQAAHQGGIVHRDLKPGNVLLSAEPGTRNAERPEPATREGSAFRAPGSGFPVPKISDFGLAKWIAAGPDQETGDLTLSGVPLGTPSYMAPEQARADSNAVGPATDVWALGAILYECLTGRPPFRGETSTATLRLVLDEEPVPPARLNPQTPRDLETICLKCLAKEPPHRYARAADLAADLRRFVAGEPILARPVGPAVRAWKWARRRPALAGMLVAVALHAVGLSAGAWLLYRQHRLAQERQAQTDREVTGLLGRARGLLDAGWPAADLARLTEAHALANRADDLARGGGAGATVRQEAEALYDRAAGLARRLANDQTLLGALEGVLSLQQTLAPFEKPTRRELVLAQPEVDEEYARAFRAWGLDVDGTTEDEAAARLAAEPRPVVQEVIAAVDGWMLLRLRHRPGADWQRLFRLAERLDGSGRRRHLREILVRGAPPRPADVAGIVGWGSPWPALWALGPGTARRSLQELRQGLDHRIEPIPTLVLFAWACVDLGDWASAEAVLGQAVRARPEGVLLLATLANVLQGQGPARAQEALGYFRAAFSRSRHQGLALGRALLGAGQPAEAEALLGELARQPPFDRDAAVALYIGDALLEQKRYGAAETAFEAALGLRPGWAPAWTNLAIARARQRKVGPAEAACRQAIACDPALPEAHVNLGAVLQLQGKDAEAAAAYRQALALRPDSAAGWIGLGNVLSHQGRFAEAGGAWGPAAPLPPGGWAAGGAGAGRRAVAADPGVFDGHYNLGTALVALGRHRAAAAAFRAALALDPEDADAHTNLGGALLELKDYAAAEAAFRQALALRPEDGRALRNLGYALLRQARFGEAAAALRRAGDLLPTGSPVGRHARQLEQLNTQYAALDARFAALLQGTEQPADAEELFHAAELCLIRKHHAAAGRLFLAAFAADPHLADKVPGNRYEAATAAALASTGQGHDAAALEGQARAGWRRQALAWLRQELAAWDRVLQPANPRAGVRVQKVMRSWQADDDLAGVREPAALAQLPPDEGAAWRAFWEEVAALLRRAETTAAGPP